MDLITDEIGPLWVYKMPDPALLYVIGIDTAEGKIRDRRAGSIDTSGKDPDMNAAVVIEESTGEEVARYMSNYAPSLFSEDVMLLGHFYGTASNCKDDAFLVPERNAIGAAVIDDLIEASYPRVMIQRTLNKLDGVWQKNVGFRTGPENRDVLIKDLQREILAGECGIRDRTTAKHVASMRRNNMGKAEAASGAHDDLAMAYMLAQFGRRMLRIESGFEDAEPIKRQSQGERDAAYAAKVYGSGQDDSELEVDPGDDHPY
jgi:phage terminase large subunit